MFDLASLKVSGTEVFGGGVTVLYLFVTGFVWIWAGFGSSRVFGGGRVLIPETRIG